MATIIDANSTHLIAALILFQLGSGPVRGFAVTLGVGIVTLVLHGGDGHPADRGPVAEPAPPPAIGHIDKGAESRRFPV